MTHFAMPGGQISAHPCPDAFQCAVSPGQASAQLEHFRSGGRGAELGWHHGRAAQRGHLQGAPGGSRHRLLPHPGAALPRGGLAPGKRSH